MTPGAFGTDGELLESAFLAQVIGLAEFYGWMPYHPPDNKPRGTGAGRQARQRVARGFPDLTLVRGPELIFAELKRHNGRPSPAQREWIAALEVVSRYVSDAVKVAAGDDGFADGSSLGDLAVDVYIWRPADWDAINARLARGRNAIAWAP